MLDTLPFPRIYLSVVYWNTEAYVLKSGIIVYEDEDYLELASKITSNGGYFMDSWVSIKKSAIIHRHIILQDYNPILGTNYGK